MTGLVGPSAYDWRRYSTAFVLDTQPVIRGMCGAWWCSRPSTRYPPPSSSAGSSAITVSERSAHAPGHAGAGGGEGAARERPLPQAGRRPVEAAAAPFVPTQGDDPIRGRTSRDAVLQPRHRRLAEEAALVEDLLPRRTARLRRKRRGSSARAAGATAPPGRPETPPARGDRPGWPGPPLSDRRFHRERPRRAARSGRPLRRSRPRRGRRRRRARRTRRSRRPRRRGRRRREC